MAATQTYVRSDAMELLISYYQNLNSLRNKLVELAYCGRWLTISSHQCSEPYEDLEQIGYFGLILRH